MLQVRRSAAGRWTARAVIKAWGLAMLVAAAAALAACGSSSGGSTTRGLTQAQSSGRSGGTIVWAKPAEVTEVDPTTAINATDTEVLSNVYEGLVGLDANARATPKLATSWQQLSPTTYVFTIRRGVRFSNGREMTVDDVVGSLKRLTDPRTAANWAPQLGRVRSIAAKGDSQVEVVLAEPNSAFVISLAHVPAAILPMKELRAGTFDPRRTLLGTGPYKVASHAQDESWSLVRNPYYRDKGLPKADKLTIRIMQLALEWGVESFDARRRAWGGRVLEVALERAARQCGLASGGPVVVAAGVRSRTANTIAVRTLPAAGPLASAPPR